VGAGPEVNRVQELEANGRQEFEVDREQGVEQYVDGGQEVNRSSGGWVTSMRLAAYASRPCCRLQTLPLPPELPAASRASYYLHNSLRPPPEPPAASRASCRLQSFVLAASGAFDLLESL
jgi:hypothetical protein